MLSWALHGVKALSLPSDCAFELIVIDNDRRRSAESAVHRFQSSVPFNVIYDCEPEQNISLARNRAILRSHGRWIAFIDDDEYPQSNWISELISTKKRFSADGVLGPVLPFYDGTPPNWLVNSGLCDRRTYETGRILDNPKDMRTGNVLLDRAILDDNIPPFDPHFGRSGGEDSAFFQHALKLGRKFVWCNTARVYEKVPRERQLRNYYVKRALLRGVNNAGREKFVSRGTFLSVAAVFFYSACLPALLFIGHHLFMRILVKNCDHGSKLLAHMGIRLIQVRSF